jgi:thioesterase domain-containing protein/acyl carrier protein
MYRTGDRARWRADGTLETLGRTDGQINIRGHRIDPGEIEAALLAIDRVRAAAVRAWPDGSGNTTIAAYVVGAPAAGLRRRLRQKLPGFMIPEHFETLDAMPLTPAGQIDREALPSPSAIENGERSLAARNELERRLTAIWESVLDARPIGIEDNFFDLGGHSFQVAKLLRKIEIEFGARLSMAAVFEAPTISLLAKLLSNGASMARVPRATTLQPAGALEPLIWVYGGPLFRTLAQTLGTHRPFVGVDLDHDDEGLEHAPFAEFATRLVRIIRERQPHGPYYLGGWCISGLLAYEIASQLLEAGEKVGLVVMIDAPNPAHYFKIPKIALLRSKAAYHLKRLLRTQIGELFPYLRERAKGLFTHLSNRSLEEESPLQKALSRAAIGYDPKPIAARVLDIQPLEHPEIWNLRESWAPHLKEGNFEIREVPGDHVTMLEEPHVAALAACIKTGLRDNLVEIRRIAAG